MKKTLSALLLSAGFLAGCETEIDITGDNTPTAVVYGVLDRNNANHVFKVNKTFLGEGNALSFAQIQDSSLIPGVRPKVVRRLNGVVDLEFPVLDTILSGKPDGTFYSGDVKAFYFREPNLTTDNGYDYAISFEYNGETVSASTVTVQPPALKSPGPNLGAIDIVSSSPDPLNPRFNSLAVSMDKPKNSFKHEFEVQFTYLEIYNDSSSALKKITVGKSLVDGSSTLSSVSSFFEAQGIFDAILGTVKDDDNVHFREIKNFEIRVISMGQDLATYVEVNNPITAVIQERPEFTNVNNGLGIFSSKGEILRPIAVGERTSRYMTTNTNWLDKKFCSRLPFTVRESQSACPR
ncbi:MAG TPA: hypothetical protein VFV37_06485 [Luteibaculaceae bacterium]|nr:hypothetical protein [Luteibaculaceae bacterium]